MTKIKIGNVWIGEGEPCRIIADIGLNHNGNSLIAMNLIDIAVKAGADIVKFQKRTPNAMTSESVLNQKFIDFPGLGKTYGEVRYNLELLPEEYVILKKHTENKVAFLVTPFDIRAVEFLEELGVDSYKVASHSLTDLPMLEKIAETKKPAILSTGMATMKQIQEAIDVFGGKNIMLMHCISQYPTEINNVNLRIIKTLKEKFNLPVGYSSHERSPVVATIAVTLGACAIERHITLSHYMEGFDHSFSMEPGEFKELKKIIDFTEAALGTAEKKIFDFEKEALENYRRVVFTTKEIKKGEKIERDMLTTKEPSIRLSNKKVRKGAQPIEIPKMVGKIAKKNISIDKPISMEDLI